MRGFTLASVAVVATLLAAVGVHSGGGVTRALQPQATPAAHSGMAGGMSGMMGGAMQRSVQTMPAAQARALGDAMPGGATVDQAANELRFSTSTVNFSVLASPDTGSDMTFRIAGLTNPRIDVPSGATVTIQFINADADTPHGWWLTSAQEPFSTMAMMDAPGAFVGSFVMPLPPATTSGWSTGTITFTANTTGTFTYLCPVMGHAQQGMYGQFVVGA